MRFLLCLVFLLLPSLSYADAISHPGGELDQWLHGSGTIEPKPLTIQRAIIIQSNNSQQMASNYPTHGISWHIVGSAESRQEMINHLMTHPEHANVRKVFSRSDLELMTRAQLLTLHDDSHNRRIVVAPQSVVTYSTPVSKPYVPKFMMKSGSGCPNGRCPINNSRVQYSY
jgi:hypothetical protein